MNNKALATVIYLAIIAIAMASFLYAGSHIASGLFAKSAPAMMQANQNSSITPNAAYSKAATVQNSSLISMPVFGGAGRACLINAPNGYCSYSSCNTGYTCEPNSKKEYITKTINGQCVISESGYRLGTCEPSRTTTSSTTSTIKTTSTTVASTTSTIATTTSTSTSSTTSTTTTSTSSTTSTTFTTVVPIVNYCSIYGGPGSSYIAGWLPINYILILFGFLVVAFIFMISRFMPTSLRVRLTQITRVEITQLVISIVILLVLLSLTTSTCNLSASLGSKVLAAAGVTGVTGLTPFEYADYYIGTLALNRGINLIGYVYQTSIKYAIVGRIFTVLSQELSISPTIGGVFQVGISYGHDFGTLYGSLSDVYFDALSPILIITIGMLFLQYLALPIFEYTAFTVLLPVALVLRFIPYSGTGLRTISNAVLAIAIAIYIIYPLMIAFDSYIIYWIYTPSLNPLYGCTNCLSTAYVLPSLPSSSFLESNALITSSKNSLFSIFGSGLGVSTPVTNNLLSSSLYATLRVPIVSVASYIIQNMSEFIFLAVFLFGLNLAVAIGFAMGLARSLDAGIEGVASFWASL